MRWLRLTGWSSEGTQRAAALTRDAVERSAAHCMCPTRILLRSSARLVMTAARGGGCGGPAWPRGSHGKARAAAAPCRSGDLTTAVVVVNTPPCGAEVYSAATWGGVPGRATNSSCSLFELPTDTPCRGPTVHVLSTGSEIRDFRVNQRRQKTETAGET